MAASIVGKSMKHKTMALAAADELRSRILSGVFEPGHQLRQDSLAAEFGMSRIPIREALFLVEREGLIKILPHRGAVVVTLSADEVDELFSMRALLEPFLLKKSAPLLGKADFKALRRIHKHYVDAMDGQKLDIWNAVNTEFHLALYQHANSPRMLSTVQNLLIECDRHTRIQLLSIAGDRDRAIGEHAELIELCETGHFSEAAEVLHDHIEHIRLGLVELVKRPSSPPPATDAVLPN